MPKQEELLSILPKLVDLGPVIDGFREELSGLFKACKAKVLRPARSSHSEQIESIYLEIAPQMLHHFAELHSATEVAMNHDKFG